MGKIAVELCKKYILEISDKDLKKVAYNILNEIDDANVVRPSSSTGKYHSGKDNEKYGNLHHCKAVRYVANRLIQSIPAYDNPIEKDIILISALFHDLQKYKNMKEKHTSFEHPVFMAEMFRYYKDDFPQIEDDLERIASNIETHMSRWNETGYSKTVLPTPTTRSQYIIVFADLIASDRNIRINEKSL